MAVQSDASVLNLRMLYKGLEVDDRTKDYVLKRIEKMERLTKEDLEYEVEIEADKKGYYRVEIMIRTPRKLYRAEETSESVEGSVDLAVDQLQAQIVKDLDKVRDLRLRGARSLKKKKVLDQAARF